LFETVLYDSDIACHEPTVGHTSANWVGPYPGAFDLAVITRIESPDRRGLWPRRPIN
jgi:hypothetical protein